MASESIHCRVCCSTAAIRQRNYKLLFSTKALKEDLPGRLSTTLDLPVCQSDSLSKVVCTPCIKKFEYLEAFRSFAKHNYQKQVSKEQFHPSICSGSSPVRPVHKTTNDTSGTGASAKRITLGVVGKRLAFTPVQSMHTQT